MAQFCHYIPILRALEFGFPIPSSQFSIYLNYITMKKTPTICINSNTLLHREERMPGNTLFKGWGFFPKACWYLSTQLSKSIHSWNQLKMKDAAEQSLTLQIRNTLSIFKSLSVMDISMDLSQCSLSSKCNNPYVSWQGSSRAELLCTGPSLHISLFQWTACVSPLHCPGNPPAHTSTMALCRINWNNLFIRIIE